MMKPVAQTIESAQIYSNKVLFAQTGQSAPRGWRRNRFRPFEAYVRGSKSVHAVISSILRVLYAFALIMNLCNLDRSER